MPAKKKSAQSANAAEKKASAKKAAPNTFTYKGKTVKGMKVTPTAAITSSGKKATGLAQRPASQRQGGAMSTNKPKAKVKSAEDKFAGSGTPLGASLAMSRPGATRNIVGAALTVSMVPGKGRIAKVVAGKVGSIADEAAFRAASKGLEASGAGGRVSRTFTPMGPTLRSTRIGTAKQQAARMENLFANADRIGTSTGRQVSGTMYGVLRQAGVVARVGGASILAGKVSKPSRKNKK